MTEKNIKKYSVLKYVPELSTYLRSRVITAQTDENGKRVLTVMAQKRFAYQAAIKIYYAMCQIGNVEPEAQVKTFYSPFE